MKRSLAFIVAVAALRVVGIAGEAVAQQSPPVTAVGNTTPGSFGVGLGAPGGTSQPTTSGSGQSSSGGIQVIPTSGGSTPSNIVWARHYWGSNPFEDPGYGTNAPFVCGANGFGPGRPYEDVGIDRATGQVVGRQSGCENPAQPSQPGSGATVVQQEPPPTAAEIWAHVPLPTPVLGINPSFNGLTGLPSWLWDPNPGPRTATVTLRGYTAVATASPVRWEWRMWQNGDTPNVNPDPIVVATRPGSEASPAATYMYETNGDFTVTSTTTWSGTYTYTGPNTAPTTVSLGTTSRTSSQPYHVISVRGARVG